MIIITLNELKNNLDKYIEIANKETIQIVDDDKKLFYLVPEKEKLLFDWDAIFGNIPKEAMTDIDINRE